MEEWELECALCGHKASGHGDESWCEEATNWVPGVFVGQLLLGELCPECCKKYEPREPVEEDGKLLFMNDQLGKTAEAFKDHPEAKERLERTSPATKKRLLQILEYITENPPDDIIGPEDWWKYLPPAE